MNAVAEVPAREGMGCAVGSTSNDKLTEYGFISVRKECGAIREVKSSENKKIRRNLRTPIIGVRNSS